MQIKKRVFIIPWLKVSRRFNITDNCRSTSFYLDGGYLCSRTKTYLLIHLEDDIIWFAGSPHTEAEKGEPYKKQFISHQ